MPPPLAWEQCCLNTTESFPYIQTCVNFSSKLSPAEQNYDIGNRELLTMKLLLEEWRHCLEGAQHPLTVIADHKNLEYFRKCQVVKPPTGLLGPLLHPAPVFHHVSTRRKECQGGFPLTYSGPRQMASPEPRLLLAFLVSPIRWVLD